MTPETSLFPQKLVTISERGAIRELEEQGVVTKALTIQYATQRDYAPVLHTIMYYAPTQPASNVEELNQIADNFPPTHLEDRTNHAEVLDGSVSLPEMFYFTSEEDNRPEGPLQSYELQKQGLGLHHVSVILFPTVELATAVALSQIEDKKDKGLYKLSDFNPDNPTDDISFLTQRELYDISDGLLPIRLWNPNGRR